MKYVIYPLRNLKEGRKRAEYPIGTIEDSAQGILLEVPDRKMAARLRLHFAETFRVRFFAGCGDAIMAHTVEEWEPGSDEHFAEGLRRLLRLNFVAVQDTNAGYPSWV